ncbi:MAG TPA: hypothetical protein VGU25_00745 [Acidobacteriaceae bacterium]|nr:hypothetical protein [Acidobacteriaceae bacterium]
MKNLSIFRTIFVVASLVAGCVSLPAHAQGEPHTMTVNVPFGFELGSKHLAPGKYTISRPLSDIVEIRNSTDGALLMTHDGQSNKATRTSKIVFDRYGDQYFLRQVWFNAEDNTYLETAESKAEKQAKRSELASVTKKASNVEIALLRLP